MGIVADITMLSRASARPRRCAADSGASAAPFVALVAKPT